MAIFMDMHPPPDEALRDTAKDWSRRLRFQADLFPDDAWWLILV